MASYPAPNSAVLNAVQCYRQVASNVTSHTLTGLTPGTNYWVSVTSAGAVNSTTIEEDCATCKFKINIAVVNS